jgi:hypothetical protein
VLLPMPAEVSTGFKTSPSRVISTRRFDRRKRGTKSIYEAINEAYPFPHDHRIFVREWPLDSVSQNGQLGSEPPKPVFQIHAPPGLSVEAKRKMTKSVNAAVAKAYNNPPDFLILFWSTRKTGWR